MMACEEFIRKDNQSLHLHPEISSQFRGCHAAGIRGQELIMLLGFCRQ